MEPWNLVFLHRYDEALSAYDTILRKRPDDRLAVANRATALLCLRRYPEALSDLVRANELAGRETDEPGSFYSENIAVVYWLMGRRSEAISALINTAEALEDGRIKYTDLAGGVHCGLLLWFMANLARKPSALAYSRRYLRARAESTASCYWPGPLGAYVVGIRSLAQVLAEAGAFQDLGELAGRARNALLARRHYCQTVFYLSVEKYTRGDRTGYAAGMASCCGIENPILELEWYLAREESRRSISAPGECP